MRLAHDRSLLPLQRQAGFTLVELALVVLVIGLILGAGIAAGTAQLLQQRIDTTRQRESALKAALKAFIARNGRLPCPAIGNLDRSNAAFGFEAVPDTSSSGTNACPGTVSVGPACTDDESCVKNRSFRGVVPWRSVGMPEETLIDSWGRFITYQVSLAGIVNPFDNQVVAMRNVQAMIGNMPVHSAVPVSSGNQITNPLDPAVVVLISHGANGSGAFVPGSTSVSPAPSGPTEVENTDNTLAVVSAMYSEQSIDPYDDIVSYFLATDLLDGVQLPIPGLETVAGRMKYFLETMAADVASTAPPSYALPSNLDDLDIPDSFLRDSYGDEITFAASPNMPTITATSPSPTTQIRRITINGQNFPVTAGDIRTIAARLGVPLVP